MKKNPFMRTTAFLFLVLFSPTSAFLHIPYRKNGDHQFRKSQTADRGLCFPWFDSESVKLAAGLDDQDTFMETKTLSEAMDPSKENDKSSKDFKIQTYNPLRWLVLRLGLTEPAYTSPFNYGKEGKYKNGTFHCAYCGQVLFDASAKYDSGSGWPSFWRSYQENAIAYKQEWDGRLECKCQRCSSHLGHVFLDGPQPSRVSSELLQNSPPSDPRGRAPSAPLPRFCINGAAMTFREEESQ